jgi:hypothetical protein
MRFIQTIISIMILTGMLAGAAPSGTLAQERPVLVEVQDPGFVSPELCTPEPANLDRVTEIIESTTGTPIVSDGSLPLFTSDIVVTGEDADAPRTLLRTMMACINANEPVRYLSLFTDSFLEIYRELVETIVEDVTVGSGANEDLEPLEAGYVLLLESDVFRLDDGRLAYTVAAGWESPDVTVDSLEPRDVVQIVAGQIDGAWLIDELRIEPYDLPPDSGVAIVESGYSGWIMPVTQAESASVLFLSMGDEVIGGFIPTGEEIAEAEAGLSSALQQHERATPALIERLATYQRQYLGLETGNGRLLVINGFCDSLGMDPATTLIAVEDGGDCYWYAIYNLTDQTYDAVYVNGES